MRFRYVEKSKLKLVPQHSGVYALSQGKEILYIGKATNLRERIKNHFHKSSYRDNLFVDKVDRVGWIETLSDIDALLLESQLIRQCQPKYNVMWKDGKGYFYVGITKEQFPRVFLTHQPQNRGTAQNHTRNHAEKFLRSSALGSRRTQVRRGSAAIIGPFVDGKAIKEVLKLLRRVFPYYVSKTHPPGLCPWCHLGLCPGPKPNPKEYKRNIRNLAAVLKGKKTSVLKSLKRAMENAAKAEHFEEASKLRDQVFAMENVMFHSLLSVPKHRPLPQPWQSFKRIEAYDISNIQGKFATGSMVTFLHQKPAKEWYRKFKIHYQHKVPGRSLAPRHGGLGARARQRQAVVSGSNDFAMMQELVSRRLKHTEWPYPNLMLIDGGKGQLTAALQALRKSEIRSTKSEIQLAALAKRHNELFLPRRKTSILLKNLPQGVSNLLLHIRDEAHRFAIFYHRKLRRIDAFSEK